MKLLNLKLLGIFLCCQFASLAQITMDVDEITTFESHLSIVQEDGKIKEQFHQNIIY